MFPQPLERARLSPAVLHAGGLRARTCGHGAAIRHRAHPRLPQPPGCRSPPRELIARRRALRRVAERHRTAHRAPDPGQALFARHGRAADARQAPRESSRFRRRRRRNCREMGIADSAIVHIPNPIDETEFDRPGRRADFAAHAHRRRACSYSFSVKLTPRKGVGRSRPCLRITERSRQRTRHRRKRHGSRTRTSSRSSGRLGPEKRVHASGTADRRAPSRRARRGRTSSCTRRATKYSASSRSKHCCRAHP